MMQEKKVYESQRKRLHSVFILVLSLENIRITVFIARIISALTKVFSQRRSGTLKKIIRSLWIFLMPSSYLTEFSFQSSPCAVQC